jgi:hypothetical protein
MVLVRHPADLNALIDGQGREPKISEIEALRGRSSLGRHRHMRDEASVLEAG